jgi:GNAT superfamily N-acetyltransferase
MNTPTINISGPFRLGGVPHVFPAVSMMFELAQKAGEVAADRSQLDPDSQVLYIQDTGKIVSAAVFFDVGNGRVWLDFLYTDETQRGRGLGRAMLGRLADLSRAEGFKRIRLGTGIGNAAMLHLAKRAGYAEMATEFALDLEPPRLGPISRVLP